MRATPALIADLLDQTVRRDPGRVALAFEGETMSYGELIARAERVASYLLDAGAGPDRLVGIVADPCLEMVVSIVATLWTGSAYLPLDPAYPAARLQHMAETSRPIAILSNGANRRLATESFWRDGGRPVLEVRELQLDTQRRAERQPVAPDNLAYVVYTSGSTGIPKAVMIAHAGLAEMIRAQIELFGISPGSRILQFASLSFDASVSEVLTALTAGARLCLAPRTALIPGEPLLRTMREQRITTVTLPPSVLSSLPEEALPDLDTVISAGEACSASIVNRWGNGRRFVNAYGPSEATVCTTAAMCKPNGRPPAIGDPLPHARVYVLDDDLAPVARGRSGQLFIAGSGVARGYRDLPAPTAAAFMPDPFSDGQGERMYRTGDIVAIDDTGALRYVSRIDHQVKIRGYRIEPGEIVHALRTQPGITDAVVVIDSHDQDNRQIVAYVIPADVDGDELRASLRAELPDFMIPVRVIGMDSWPLSPNGKIDRAQLPRPARVLEVCARTYVAPRDSTELALIGIWEDLLGRAPLGVNDDFFTLGGHSLLALRMVALVQSALGASCNIETIAEHPTISRLARHLRSLSVDQAGRADIVTLQEGDDRPPLFLAPPVHGSPMCYVALTRLLDPQWPCYGLRAPAIDGEMRPPDSIDAIAEYYLAAVRALRPRGPYLLGGWSMGGIIAFEMARQLEQAGEAVKLLAVIEATVPAPAHCAYMRRYFEDFAPSRMASLYVRNIAESVGKPIAISADEYAGRDPEHIHCDVLAKLRALDIAPPEMTVPEVAARLDVFRATLLAMYLYPLRARPKYTGEAVVFSSQAGHPFMPADCPTSTWHEFVAGRIETRSIPGNHYTVCHPAHVRGLASELSAVLLRL